MRYRVVHRTEYHYATEVSRGYSEARLTPRTMNGQRCDSFRLDVVPSPQGQRTRDDHFGNRTVHFEIHEPHTELSVVATSEVDVEGSPEVRHAGPSDAWDVVRDHLRHPGAQLAVLEAREFVLPSPLVPALPELAEYAAASFPVGRPLMEAVLDLNDRVHRDFAYDPGATTTSTPLQVVLATRRGVCQDFAHLLIGCLRSLGLAARYVSGYLETDPPPGQAKLVGADASHAWVSVFWPDHGWFDLDPTNASVPGERHITTAWGRDYSDVTPLKGVVFSGGGAQRLLVSVDVTRLEG